MPDLDDSAWETVSIPHTLKLTDLNLDGCCDDKTQPTFHRTVGWYRRTLIRAGLQAGQITVRAECEGLDAQVASVTSLPFDEDVLAANARPIYELQKIRVDLGAQGQLVQFDWTPWFGESDVDASTTLPYLSGVKVALKCGSNAGAARWLGEMNVKGFHGYVIGEGVCVVDPEGFSLEFQGLPQGKYSLKTYHHAPSSNTDSMDPNRERLKTLKINQIPVAETVSVRAGNSRSLAKTSHGKVISAPGLGTASVEFEVGSDARACVSFKDADGQRGIWLNGFELQQAR